MPPTRETTGVSLYVFACTTPVASCPAASDDGRSPTVSILNCAVFICSAVNVSFCSPVVPGGDDSPNETERGAETGLPACCGHKSQAAIAIPIRVTAATVIGITERGCFIEVDKSGFECFSVLDCSSIFLTPLVHCVHHFINSGEAVGRAKSTRAL